MRTYLVGGAVRDMVMGVEPKDRDYVVVGATEDQMLSAGFSRVGASFPVFLHPESGDEYALARVERKVGVGYTGFEVTFDPSIRLEDDLKRRDLTMNAMAIEVIDGHLVGDVIDPYDGKSDIRNKVIRHVSESFAEDPVRVLRAARFAARYGFSVDPATNELMRQIAPELNFVPAERIFAEFEKGIGERYYPTMFDVLRECGAWRVGALRPYSAHHHGLVSSHFNDILTRKVLLLMGFTSQDMEHCRIPSDLRRYTSAVQRTYHRLASYHALSAKDRVRLLNDLRAFSDMPFCQRVISVVSAVIDVPIQVHIDWEKASSIDAYAVASSTTASKIGEAILDARAAAIEQ